MITFPQMVMVYKAGEKKFDLNKIQIIVPEEGRITLPGAKGGTGGSSEQERAEKALEEAFGTKAPSAPSRAGCCTQRRRKPPQGTPEGATGPGSEQDDAAKALEKAFGTPKPADGK